MKKSEVRHLVVNVVWAKGLYREFTAIQVEDVARAQHVQASIEFIYETLDKIMQRGGIEGRRLIVNGYGEYKWLKASDGVSEQQQTAITLHHSQYRKERRIMEEESKPIVIINNDEDWTPERAQEFATIQAEQGTEAAVLNDEVKHGDGIEEKDGIVYVHI